MDPSLTLRSNKSLSICRLIPAAQAAHSVRFLTSKHVKKWTVRGDVHPSAMHRLLANWSTTPKNFFTVPRLSRPVRPCDSYVCTSHPTYSSYSSVLTSSDSVICDKTGRPTDVAHWSNKTSARAVWEAHDALCPLGRILGASITTFAAIMAAFQGIIRAPSVWYKYRYVWYVWYPYKCQF